LKARAHAEAGTAAAAAAVVPRGAAFSVNLKLSIINPLNHQPSINLQ
jgi:hypothetical protein